MMPRISPVSSTPSSRGFILWFASLHSGRRAENEKQAYRSDGNDDGAIDDGNWVFHEHELSHNTHREVDVNLLESNGRQVTTDLVELHIHGQVHRMGLHHVEHGRVEHRAHGARLEECAADGGIGTDGREVGDLAVLCACLCGLEGGAYGGGRGRNLSRNDLQVMLGGW